MESKGPGKWVELDIRISLWNFRQFRQAGRALHVEVVSETEGEGRVRRGVQAVLYRVVRGVERSALVQTVNCYIEIFSFIYAEIQAILLIYIYWCLLSIFLILSGINVNCMVAFDVVSNIAIVFIMKNLKKNTRDALLFFYSVSFKKTSSGFYLDTRRRK